MNYRRIGKPGLQIEASTQIKDTSQAEDLYKSPIINPVQDQALSQIPSLAQDLDLNLAQDLLIPDQTLNLLQNQAQGQVADRQTQDQAAGLQILDQVAGLQILDQAQDHRQAENLLHDLAICELDINKYFK